MYTTVRKSKVSSKGPFTSTFSNVLNSMCQATDGIQTISISFQSTADDRIISRSHLHVSGWTANQNEMEDRSMLCIS